MAFQQEIEEIMTAYVAAFNAQNAAECAAIYTEDATIFSPFGPPIRGRAAIVAEHKNWLALGEENKRIDVLDCAASGDLGYCLITYAADITGPDGTQVTEKGTNLCAMVRRAERWQIQHSSMNETVSD